MNSNSKLDLQIEQNKKYLREARNALAEMRKSINEHGRTAGLPERFEVEPDLDSVIAVDGILPAENLGQFMSVRNGKGWLKMRV